MKKRILISVVFVLSLMCLFAISISAATTNEFSNAPTLLDNIDLTGMSTDTTSRVVLMHETTKDGVTTQNFTTYPSQYIVKSNGDFAIDYSKINAALISRNFVCGWLRYKN